MTQRPRREDGQHGAPSAQRLLSRVTIIHPRQECARIEIRQVDATRARTRELCREIGVSQWLRSVLLCAACVLTVCIVVLLCRTWFDGSSGWLFECVRVAMGSASESRASVLWLTGGLESAEPQVRLFLLCFCCSVLHRGARGGSWSNNQKPCLHGVDNLDIVVE